MVSIQLNPSTLRGASQHLKFVPTYFVPAPANISSGFWTKIEDPHMTSAAPVFFWKATPRKTEALEGLVHGNVD